MKRTDIQLLVILFLFTGLVYFYGSMLGLENQLTKTHQQYETQSACDWGVRKHDLSDCYKLEDKYNMEHLCQSLDSTSYCWTEVK